MSVAQQEQDCGASLSSSPSGTRARVLSPRSVLKMTLTTPQEEVRFDYSTAEHNKPQLTSLQLLLALLCRWDR